MISDTGARRLDDKMAPGGVQNEARQINAVLHGTGAEIEKREISQMQYADGSFNFSLPEAKCNQASDQMLREWYSFVEQLEKL